MIDKLRQAELFLTRRTEHGVRRALELLREAIKDAESLPASPVVPDFKRGPGRPRKYDHA